MTVEVLTSELLSRFPVERLGWMLLHFLWQGTAIGLAYAVLRSLLRRSLSAQGRYVLACAALIALTAAPVVTFAVNPVAEATGEFSIRVLNPDRLLRIAVALWIAGVVVFSVRMLGGWRFAARLRSASNPPAASWQQTLEALAAALGVRRRVRLLISPLVDVPVVVGWLRPAILVPIEFFTGFPAEHVRALLAHELAHVLRHDYLANILQGVAETILFYHPAVWWISKQIRAEREKCCDDLAVAATGDVAAYVRALANLETKQFHHLRQAVASNGGSLLERVRRLIEPAQPGAENLPGPAAAWSMMLLWLAGISAAALHAAPAPLPIRHVAPSHYDAPPPQAILTEQLPPSPEPAFTAIRKTTRKALLYDPLLSLNSAPAPAAIQPPEAAPALALNPEPVNLAMLAGIEQKQRMIHPPAAVARQTTHPAAEPGDSSAPMFHTSSRLVLVDVIARGKGARRSTLTQQDFTLLDNGKPQDIAFFSPASNLAPQSAPAPLAAGAISNRLQEDGATPPNATVLLIDQSNTPQDDQAFVLQRLRKFLERRRSKPAQRQLVGIYIYGQSGTLQVVQELTGDDERLIQAAASIRPQSPIFADGETDPTPRVLETNDVIEAVARHLGTVPGGKNLIWISSGFPPSASHDDAMLPDFTPRMERTARVLTDANLAFYAVDARGLQGGLPFMGLALSPAPMFPAPVAARTALPMQATVAVSLWPLDGTNAFSRLASLTGGRTFSDSNGIEDSIQDVLDDSAFDYTLGFYPSEAERSPNWHKLKVKVRQHGIGVRYREKYFSTSGDSEDDARRALPALLKGPLDATQLQLVARASLDRERPGRAQVSVSIDLHGLHLEKQSNNWVGAVDVSFLLEGSQYARIIGSNIKIANDQLEAALEKGVTLAGSIDTGGKRELHVVAQDRATGAAGSLTVPLSR